VDRKQLKAWIASAKLAPLTGAPSPRPYQIDGLKELGKIRSEGGSRALVVMASGLGKTHLAAFDVRAFQAETGKPTRVLYLSHQSVILDQARRTFGNVFGTARSYGRFDGEAHEPQADFVFGSFQSVYDSLDLFEPTSFDYVIVDEAHHTAAPTRDAVVSHVRPQFMLGLTATPFRGDGKDIYTYYNDTVAVSLPVEKAIVQGLLAPIEYRMISDIADPNALNLALRSAGKIKAGKLFKPRSDSEIVNLVWKSAAQLAQTPKILVFCASLKQMQHFAEVFDDSRTISGIDDRKTQISVVEDFREGKFTTLLSRDVLNEGIDVPDANCLVFLRNTESPVVFLQQLGRGLRKAEGKDRVLVLDFVSNLDRFEFVYSFLSHLRAEQEARERTEREYQPPESILHLDQTARDVISELVTKKQQRGFITELSSLVAAFNYKVSVQTLQHLVELGKLIPDFVLADESGRERRYFEKPTVERLLRQSASARHLEGLIPERIVAKRLGVTVGWLKHQEKSGTFGHRGSIGVSTDALSSTSQRVTWKAHDQSSRGIWRKPERLVEADHRSSIASGCSRMSA